MAITHKAMIFTLLMILFMPLVCGQACQRSESLTKGVHLIVGPFDSFSRAFGLKDETIDRSARDALTAEGLTLDERSEVMITVRITSLPQVSEDLFPFRIEVHAGTVPTFQREEGKNAVEISDIPAVTVVNASWNNDEKVLLGVRERVSAVAKKLRREMIRIREIER